jgi:hypothetical protein
MFFCLDLHAAELHVAPDDYVILATPNPSAGVHDLVLPAVGIRSTGPGSERLEAMRIELWKNGVPLVTRSVPPERLIEDTNRMANLPAPFLIAAQVFSARGLDGFFGAAVTLSDDADLSAGEALVTTRHFFSVDFEPEFLRVVARVTNHDGLRNEVDARVPVRRYEPAHRYSLPLAGAWLAHSWPSLQSHHRFLPSTEFGIDFYAVRDGWTSDGDPDDPTSYFGYGAEVLAAADGEVVQVIADARSDRQRKAAERARDPDAFVSDYLDSLAKDPLRSVAGNIVIIRHTTDVGTEYSMYAHLMEGSVSVKPGDELRRGQVIARLGDTGEFIEPHLHFQVSSGPDLLLSRSLPVKFENLETGPGLEGDLGRLVRASVVDKVPEGSPQK